MKGFLYILSYVGTYKKYAVLNVVFNILTVIFNLLSMLIFIPFLELIFDPKEIAPVEKPAFELSKDYFEQLYDYYTISLVNPENKMDVLIYICIIVLILFFLKNLSRYLAMYFLAVIRNGVVARLRKKLYQKITKLPLSFFSDERKGDIMARLSTDVNEVDFSIMSSLELMFREPVSIIVSLAFMFFISPSLTIFSLLLLPFSALIIGRVAKSLKRTSVKGQSKLGELISNIEETLSGLRIIKAFNAEKNVNQSFEHLNDDYRKLMIRLYRKRDLASPLSEFLGSFVMVSLVWYGGSLILDSPESEPLLTGKSFIGYIIIFSQLLRPVQALSNGYSNVSKGLASLDRINNILGSEEKIPEIDHPKEICEFNGYIAYNNVSFSYTDEEAKKYVLKNINFTVEKGKTVALVGESGGGKSTLADLLPRFYHLSEGAISIDGQDINDLKIGDLRGLMGIVTQQSILFNGTIFNNIAFGQNEATLDEVIVAAKIANAHEFIEKLPQGYQTNIGDGGNKLSGGQRQRLSIARAILKNPPILILDEATSALDTESEKLVQEALEKLMKNRTSIIIAHRLSTIQHADEILVIQDGEIVERGKHQELLKQKGVYKKLSDLQSFQ